MAGRARKIKKPLRKHLKKSGHHKKMILMQKLSDYEHLISMDTGTFLVLLEEGTPRQIDMSKSKAKTSLIKFAPEMFKLADELGGQFPKTVEDFLHSIDDIVHTMTGWIDSAKIQACYKATQKLEKALHKKRLVRGN